MGSITLKKLTFNPETTLKQFVTIRWKLASAPDMGSSYMLAGLHVEVQPDGTFEPEYIIDHLPNNTWVTVLIQAECGLAEIRQDMYTTGESAATTSAATTVPPTVGATTVPPTVPPTTVPATVPPTTVPPTVPPTTVPPTVPPTTVPPTTVPPTTVPPTIPATTTVEASTTRGCDVVTLVQTGPMSLTASWPAVPGASQHKIAIYDTLEKANANNPTNYVTGNINFISNEFGGLAANATYWFRRLYTINGVEYGMECPASSIFLPSIATINQISNQSDGPGTIRTQVFQVGPSVPPNVPYTMSIYAHLVSITSGEDETPSVIAIRLRDAINATTAEEWRSEDSAPLDGTPGFKPTATASGINLTTTSDHHNAFVAYTY